MILTDKRYNALKFIALHVIPSLETFWLAIGMAWKLPYTSEIGVTIAAVGMFLGGCIGMSKAAYDRARKDEYEGSPEAAEDHE